jgi:hypothetical protein
MKVLLFVFLVFIAKDIHGVQYKGSGDSTTVDAQTLLEAFLNKSLRSIRFTEEQFSGTSKTSSLAWDYSPQVLD